jgi:hypothetical protein
MASRSLSYVAVARLLALMSDGKNEQAIVAAARTILEATGVLGTKSRPMDTSDQRRASDMTADEMRAEIRAQTVSKARGTGDKGLQ